MNAPTPVFVGEYSTSREKQVARNGGHDRFTDTDGWTFTVEGRGKYWVIMVRDECGHDLGTI